MEKIVASSDYFYQMGLMLYSKKEYAEAIPYFEKAAKEGHVDANYYLGAMYYYGLGTAVSYDTAIIYFKYAAEQGNKFAQNNLGYCYYEGLGVKKDYDLAFSWFQYAASQGNYRALYSVGYFYQYGLSVNKSMDKAIEYYMKSASFGFDSAIQKLLYLKDNGYSSIQIPRHLLNAKNKGPCKELLGKVMPLIVFVNTPSTIWNKEDKDKFYINYHKAREFILKEAKKYNVNNLEIGNTYYFSGSINEEPTLETFHVVRREIARTTFNQTDGKLVKLYPFYQEKYQQDSTPFILAFKKGDRGYATSTPDYLPEFQEEAAAVFLGSSNIVLQMVHELLHLYGAKDYYQPEILKNYVKNIYPNSIMLDTYNQLAEIDPLTAYLIGWKDSLDSKSIELLDYFGNNGGIPRP